jgi:hypothetical protein
MLNCTVSSQAKKTAGIAVAYRAGSGEMFGTCPDSCALKPKPTGTLEIDREYERAVRRAVPKRGQSFLFTHFAPDTWAEKNKAGFCVFNYSADKIRDAVKYVKKGIATVTVVPVDFWKDKKKKTGIKIDGVQFVRCPNETNQNIGCSRCGNGIPLCARFDRDFGVIFTAHGAGKKLAGDSTQAGGCYAGGGNVAIHWRNLSKKESQPETDSEMITRFAKGLAPRSIMRPHIAGDLGLEPKKMTHEEFSVLSDMQMV